VAKRKSFLLRIPPDLHRDLEIWAGDELRSINAQIEFLLREAVRKRKGGKAEAPRPAPEDAGGGEDDRP
jgi:hypothetical protein